MNKILLFISILAISCSNNASHEGHEQGSKSAPTLQLNNGAKWKADEPTQKNVSAIVKVINDSIYLDEKNRAQLSNQLQTRIDTLIQECRMKGPDHDALHLWLEQVLHDLKELKETDKDYQKSFATLKKDVENFYAFFE